MKTSNFKIQTPEKLLANDCRLRTSIGGRRAQALLRRPPTAHDFRQHLSKTMKTIESIEVSILKFGVFLNFGF
jgi:hypothetical protein